MFKLLICCLKHHSRDPSHALKDSVDDDDDKVTLGVKLEDREDEERKKDKAKDIRCDDHLLRVKIR